MPTLANVKVKEIVMVSFFMHLYRHNQNNNIQLFLMTQMYSHFFDSGFDDEG